MKNDGYRKLDVDLPQQHLVHQRPFAVAGWMLAAAVLLLMALSFVLAKK